MIPRPNPATVAAFLVPGRTLPLWRPLGRAAAGVALCLSLSGGISGREALFRGVVVAEHSRQPHNTQADAALFQGQVTDLDRTRRNERRGAAERALDLALPAAGVLPHDAHRPQADGKSAGPRIRVNIGIGISGSSRSSSPLPARKPASIGRVR